MLKVLSEFTKIALKCNFFKFKFNVTGVKKMLEKTVQGAMLRRVHTLLKFWYLLITTIIYIVFSPFISQLNNYICSFLNTRNIQEPFSLQIVMDVTWSGIWTHRYRSFKCFLKCVQFTAITCRAGLLLQKNTSISGRAEEV